MRRHPSLTTLAESRFFCTQESLDSFVHSLINRQQFSGADDDTPSYFELATEDAQILSKKQEGDVEISLTTDFENIEIKDNSIAYHKVDGIILAEDYWWYFSTKRFVENVKAAEKNPQINAHLLHVRSGGGDAWYLEVAFKVLSECTKPTYCLIEKVACSAAYYLAAPCTVIKALTINDIIGSLGTMASTWNWDEYYKKQGVVKVEAYATKSDLKNKKYTDLKNGKPEQFIKEELDPLQEQFEAAVRAARPTVAKLPADDPVVRGETFDSVRAKENGLIDGILTSIEEAVIEAHALGMEYKSKQNTFKNALTYI